MHLQKYIEHNIISSYIPDSLPSPYTRVQELLASSKFGVKSNFDIFLFLDTITCTFSFLCEINDNSYYLQFHCHFNPFYMKRHFSTFYGHFPFRYLKNSR